MWQSHDLSSWEEAWSEEEEDIIVFFPMCFHYVCENT